MVRIIVAQSSSAGSGVLNGDADRWLIVARLHGPSVRCRSMVPMVRALDRQPLSGTVAMVLTMYGDLLHSPVSLSLVAPD